MTAALRLARAHNGSTQGCTHPLLRAAASFSPPHAGVAGVCPSVPAERPACERRRAKSPLDTYLILVATTTVVLFGALRTR